MTSLFSQEGLISLVFLAMLGITVFGALVTVTASRLIRSVAGLLLCLIGVAGIYYFLNSPFVALMQLLIYVGAVGVVIAFAVMLADPNPEKQPAHGRNPLTGGLGFLTSGVAFAGLAFLGWSTPWQRHAGPPVDSSMVGIGKSLLTTYSLVFELISIVLLIAIIGSLVLARAGREKS